MIQKKLRWKDKIFLGLVVIGLMFVLWNKLFGEDTPTAPALQTMQVGQAEVKVEKADTPAMMYTGLSGRASLPADQGMVFVHPAPGIYKYVMRDMQFDLDFVFIKENKVVDFAEQIKASFSGQIFGATDYDKVLEVNAGWISQHGIKLGDEVRIGQ